jgi:hypothetical protein
LIRERSDHYGDVVRREAPEHALFPPYLAQAQPVRIDVVDIPERAVLDELVQTRDRRMVFEDVADHEDAPPLLGERHQLRPLLVAERERFLH